MKHIYQSIRVLSLKAYCWLYQVKYVVLKVQCRKSEAYFPVFQVILWHFQIFVLTLQIIIRNCNMMKTDDKPIPVNRIKAVLAEKQVSAKQLCVAVGKNEATVSRWCNNKIQPSVTQLQAIAHFLDVDVRELLCPTK